MKKGRANTWKKTMAAVAAAAMMISGTGTMVSAQEAASVGDGTPWVDSDLKENIPDEPLSSPKDDFHLYINQEWLKNTEIPDGYNNVSVFLEVYISLQENLKALLEDNSLEGHEAKLVQDCYSAFLDWEERNEQGIEPAVEMAEAIQQIDSIEELSDFLCDGEKTYFLEAFLKCEMMMDLADSTRYVPDIFGAEFVLSDAAEYAQRTEYGERFYQGGEILYTYLLQRLGYSEEEAKAKYDDFISFEAKLAEVSLTQAEMMQADYISKIYNMMSLSEVEELAPNYPIRRWIESLGFEEAEQFMVDEPAYLGRVSELYTEENLEQIKNYLLIRYLKKASEYLDEETYRVYLEADNVCKGASGYKEDEIYALETVKEVLSEPLAKAYLEKYPAEKKKEDITRICQEVIDAYRGIIEGEEWMSSETREKAVEKLDNITIHAVYPEKWYDFGSLSLDGLSYYECRKAIADLAQKREQGFVNSQMDRELWPNINILDVNAYYSLQDNSINIILGILGNEYYNENMSREEMLGGIGTAIAHEVSHAFDTTGAQFDAYGNFADWWQPEDYDAFSQRAQKMVDYYDNIVAFEGTHVSGSNVVSEAIADIAGMKCILAIAKETENFDYDAFFRQYTSVQKRISSEAFEYECLTQDVHPLSYLRTNVTLQQFDEFLEEYDIQPGDNMYLAPEDRILVW